MYSSLLFFHLANKNNVQNTCALLFCSLTAGFPPLDIGLSYQLDNLVCYKSVLTLAK